MTFQYLPPLSDDDYEALKADIAKRGVLVAVEYDEGSNILDGHHRVRACEELGITEWPRITRSFTSDADKRTHARQLNLARRQLTREQKRVLIEDELRDRPERSNRQIAAGLGVDHKTVLPIRERLQATGEIPQLTETVGADGRLRPSTRPNLGIAADVMRTIRGTFLDNPIYANGLKKFSDDEQRAKVERDIQANVKRRKRRKRVPVVPPPLGEDESNLDDEIVAELLAVWDRASAVARHRFLECVRPALARTA